MLFKQIIIGNLKLTFKCLMLFPLTYQLQHQTNLFIICLPTNRSGLLSGDILLFSNDKIIKLEEKYRERILKC